MLNDFTGADKVYIACGYTDLRKGIDGLATMVQQQFELDPFTNTLFRAKAGPNKRAVLGTGWLHPPLQEAGAGSVPVAEVRS